MFFFTSIILWIHFGIPKFKRKRFVIALGTHYSSKIHSTYTIISYPFIRIVLMDIGSAMHFRSVIRLHRNVAFRYIDGIFFYVAVVY